MAANFYGSVESEGNFSGINGGGGVEFNIRSQEEYQSAMLIFNEVNQEVQKMRADLTHLTETVNEFCSNQGSVNSSSTPPQKVSKKLPEGLSVRKHTMLMCY